MDVPIFGICKNFRLYYSSICPILKLVMMVGIHRAVRPLSDDDWGNALDSAHWLMFCDDPARKGGADEEANMEKAGNMYA